MTKSTGSLAIEKAHQRAGTNTRQRRVRWTRDELVMALWTAAQRDGDRVRVTDADVQALSFVLRSARSEADLDRRCRNAHGVARKVWRFMDYFERRQLLDTRCPEWSVFQEFEGDYDALAVAAEAAQARILSAVECPAEPSRGPHPFSGTIVAQRKDGPAWVYLAVLDGLLLASGQMIFKVGWSVDPPRREADLNFGLPRCLDLTWRVAKAWKLQDQMSAYKAEQAILTAEAQSRRSAGGEFLLTWPEAVDALVAKCGTVVRTIESVDILDRRWRYCTPERPQSGAVSL